MPRITRPQVYRVVREMLPKQRLGASGNCCGGWRMCNCATGGQAALTPSAEPPGKTQPSHLHKHVVVILGSIRGRDQGNGVSIAWKRRSVEEIKEMLARGEGGAKAWG